MEPSGVRAHCAAHVIYAHLSKCILLYDIPYINKL